MDYHRRRRGWGRRRRRSRFGRLVVEISAAEISVRVVFNPVPGDTGVILQVITDEESKIVVDRTGVGLLVLDAQVWEGVDDRARLDLELPSQFVDSDLTHRWRKKLIRGVGVSTMTAH
jgi:hypothetical protein